MSDEKLQCKVKIGCNYEPKWFEKRQTNGWYSGKNPPLDQDAMKLQDALLGDYGFTKKARSSGFIYTALGISSLITLYTVIYFIL
jgi:hypothetical protein